MTEGAHKQYRSEEKVNAICVNPGFCGYQKLLIPKNVSVTKELFDDHMAALPHKAAKFKGLSFHVREDGLQQQMRFNASAVAIMMDLGYDPGDIVGPMLIVKESPKTGKLLLLPKNLFVELDVLFQDEYDDYGYYCSQ